MERRPDIGLDSYDRFFPNQDTLPQGGFGNLIALPLQKQPGSWATAFSSTTTSNLMPTNGRSCRRFTESIALPLRKSYPTPKGRGALSVYALSLRKTTTLRRGPRLPRPSKRTAARRAFAGSHRADSRQSDLHRQGPTAPRAAKSAASAGGVSESRVLQGAGDASADL